MRRDARYLNADASDNAICYTSAWRSTDERSAKDFMLEEMSDPSYRIGNIESTMS